MFMLRVVDISSVTFKYYRLFFWYRNFYSRICCFKCL